MNDFTQFALTEYKNHQEYYLERQDKFHEIVVILLWQKYCKLYDVYSHNQGLLFFIKILYYIFVVPLRFTRRKYPKRWILKLEISMEMLLIKILSFNTR